MEDITDLGWYLEGALDYSESLVVPITSTPFVIGRDQVCDLSMTSNEISRKHAQIRLDESTLYVDDLNSTNGTFLNRLPVSDPCPVRQGDVLHFGNVEFRVNRRLKWDNSNTNTQIINNPDTIKTGKFVDYAREIEFLMMLEQADVETWFQPIVDLAQGRVIGYEVLGRGNRAGLPQDPSQLLSLGEKLKKEVELSELFRLRGVQLGAALPGNPLLFLNTHPGEKFGHEFELTLRKIRAIAPTQPIALEIHESAVAHPATMKWLRRLLTDMGIDLVYDDFGAGQARLNELVEVPPDFLKFDMCLVTNIHSASEEKQNMVRKLVDIATELGVSTVAEGIERAEECEACKQIGFTHGQGYYFGKPASVDAVVGKRKKNGRLRRQDRH